MRAHDLFNEDLFGTEPKRPARAGTRPARGKNSEPRYKSAPVVPGGDNPDAVHVPNKGDEPVERGDQVVVQDPDNIATVLTGTVKRIGREHVYVTLKNGETIAAPHDEVSKSYEVLSKRAHRILDKKGPSRSKYKVDEQGVAEGSGPQVGDAVYYGNRLVGWFKGYSKHGKIITEPNEEEMGDEYANRDVYWDPQDKITIKPEQGVAEGYKPRSKIEERLTSQDKFEKHLKKHGYDVNEKSKYWDQKVKDMEAQLAAWDEQMRQRKSNATTSEMASPGAVASKVTRIQGREYLLHSLPADMSKVKLVTDDSGKQVYVWVEKAGMRPQYTYYWFAPAQSVQEGWKTGAMVGATAAALALGGYNGYKFRDEVNKLEKAQVEMVVKDPAKAAELKKAITRIRMTMGNAKLNATTVRSIEDAKKLVNESICAKHISPSGAETTMCPDDDDYEINYGKDSGIDDFRKKNGLDVRTGKKVKEECAGVGIVTKQNSTADVGPGTIKKNLKAFNLEEILSELGVDKTLKFAKKAHGDQMYGDQPYWTHPRDVAAAGKRFFGTKFNNDAIKVAFLHDVVEDTPYKLKQLKNMGLSPEVIEAVELLTKNKALSYEENIKRIIASGNRLAMMVKYADNYKNYTGDKSSWNPKRAEKSQQKYQASLNMLGSKLGVDKHTQPIDRDAHVADMEQELEEWKASRQLCRSSTPDSELGASALASCKSQGLRARDGNKSHKVGNKRITVGGHRIKGKKYGGPLPDYGTRK